MTKKKGRRGKTPFYPVNQIQSQRVSRIIADASETFAALAWQGYQQQGPGLFLVNVDTPHQQGGYVPRNLIVAQQDAKTLAMIDAYNPELQVILALKFTYPVPDAIVTLYTPRVPPPQAQVDPMKVRFPDEPRH